MGEISLTTSDCLEYALALSMLSRKSICFACTVDISTAAEYIKVLSPSSKWVSSGDGTRFVPGQLNGGKIRAAVRNIPDVLAPAILLSPLMGSDLALELTGITNYACRSTDLFKITYYKIFTAFSLPKFELSIKKRGFEPLGGGCVVLKAKAVRKFDAVNLGDHEKIDKIRGFVITARIGSNAAQRMITTIKTDLSSMGNPKVLCIVNNKDDSGPSPGSECSVLGESKNGVYFETVSGKDTPEEMAKACCLGLLGSIRNGRVFDQKLLPDVILLMGLATGTSRLLIGKLDRRSKTVLGLLKQFLKVRYNVERDGDDKVLTVVGCGYSNIFMPLN